MTNPFQHGPSGFNPDSSLAAGLPTTGRGSSYASVVSGAAAAASNPSRAPFHYLLNPATDGTDMHASSLYSTRSHDMDSSRNGLAQSSAAPRLLSASRPQFQGFSRAFEMFMNRDVAGGESSSGHGGTSLNHPSRFLSPSYLKGSTYLRKLEQAHRARLLSQREGQSTQAQGSSALPSSGGAGSHHSHGLHHGKLVAAAHRGMAYDVVERPPQPEEEGEGVSPLPSRWNKDDKYGGLEVLGDGLEVKYAGHRASGERDHEACSIRADHPIPAQCGLYYFEVTILNRKRDDTTIGIGFSSKAVALSRAPGWEPESWGYHGDDGHCFASQNVGKPYGPTYGAGDTVGCGINFNTGQAFFTKNGHYLGTAFREVKGKLFPTVGLKKSGEHVWTNFGQVRFQFNIDDMMKAERAKIQREIDNASTAKLAPPLGETELVQQLVLQFLQHDGYIETARAFAEEIHAEKKSLTLDPDAEVGGINIRDDEDANKRQRIRRAILEGDIDRALKYTNMYYPQVLKDNEQVYFRLRCRKFIEMIRKDSEVKLLSEKASNGHLLLSLAQNDDQEMELDENGSGGWEQMDTEDAGGDGGEAGAAGLGKLLQEAIEYGRELRAEFSTDPRREVGKYLDEIFSLLAYSDPWKHAEVSHLLDRTGRVAVAEELNSAILLSLGKSSRAALENLYAQTSVLLDDLRQDGGPGSFVTLQGVIDEIPRSSYLM